MRNTNLREYICFNFYLGWREIQRFYSSALNGVSAQQSYVLQLLDPDIRTSMSEISTQMQLDKAPVSNLLARMEASGLVKRLNNPYDRRIIDVILTEEGGKAKDDIQEKMIPLDRELFAKLSQNEVSVLKRLVDKIQNA